MPPKKAKKEDISLVDPDIFELHAHFCKIFSDPKRLRIMWRLKEGECSVGDLAEELGVTVTNVSQHLRVMRDKGAVETRRDGKTIYYRVANMKFTQGCLLIREGLVEELRRKGAVKH